MTFKDVAEYIKNAFNTFVVPTIEFLAKNVNLYYVSLGIFAFAVLAGAISLLLRLSLKKARNKNCGKLLTLFAMCFVLDLFVCLSEHEFNAIYFKTLFGALAFCFLKLIIWLVFYFIVVFESSIMRRRDKKFEQKNKPSSQNDNSSFGKRASNVSGECESVPYCVQYDYDLKGDFNNKNPYFKANSPARPYATVAESPAEPIDFFANSHKSPLKNEQKPRSIEILERVNLKNASENGFVQPDVNVGYVHALCESLKRQTVSETDREKIADLELSLKMDDLTTPEKVRVLNESLRWLIKKIADVGAEIY